MTLGCIWYYSDPISEKTRAQRNKEAKFYQPLVLSDTPYGRYFNSHFTSSEPET